MQHNSVAFLEGLTRLVTDDGFAFAILPAVVIAAVLAFGFGATPEVVASILMVGVVDAIAENRLRAKN